MFHRLGDKLTKVNSQSKRPRISGNIHYSQDLWKMWTLCVIGGCSLLLSHSVCDNQITHLAYCVWLVFAAIWVLFLLPSPHLFFVHTVKNSNLIGNWAGCCRGSADNIIHYIPEGASSQIKPWWWEWTKNLGNSVFRGKWVFCAILVLKLEEG